jgi:outer membrane protein assembly factor BamB
MNKLALVTVGLFLTIGSLAAQPATRIYTRPPVPPAEALDRLNLNLAWYTYVPSDGQRDGIFSMLILDDQLLVLMRGGAVLALDPATGATQWRTRVGRPYVPPVGFGANSRLLLVAKGVSVYGLDRRTGSLQWEFNLPNAPTASPAVDEERFYIPMGTNKLFAYALPGPEPATPVAEGPPSSAGEARPAAPARSGPLPSVRVSASVLGATGSSLQAISAVSSAGRTVRAIGPLSSAGAGATEEMAIGPQPRFLWNYVTETRPETRVEQSSILVADFVFQVGANGLFFTISKFEPRMFYRFQADAATSAALGQYDDIAYVPSDDFRVYAINIVTGKILWRFVGGGPIRQKPRVTDDSVYVAADRTGLYRLDRATGDTIWRNGAAARFLAVNPKFVYAVDHSGRLLILDRANGAELAGYEATRDFVIPISNDVNDRVYLASNDGLLICLHDRDYPAPVPIKRAEVKAPTAGAEPKKAAPATIPAKPAVKKPAAEDKDEKGPEK